MRFTNNSGADVLLFVYNFDDAPYHWHVRDQNSPHIIPARAEAFVAVGQTVTLVHPTDRIWLAGIKSAAFFGRLEPFLVRLTLDFYTKSSVLELTPAMTLVLANAPTVPDQTPWLAKNDMIQPLPPAIGHLIGVGRANITDMSVIDKENAPQSPDWRSALPMQGWASPSQKSAFLDKGTTGEPLPLQARAFILGDPDSQTRAVFVVADIWSCSMAIRREVVRRLSFGDPESPYRDDNILIAGTHTHSAPGGYLQHFLYIATCLGFDQHVFESIVSGIVRAVQIAHASLAPGRVRLTRGLLPGVTRNRSDQAFQLNPQIEQDVFPAMVDERMTQLTFEHETAVGSGKYHPVGLLNWFAIHTTNMGKQWQGVSGDNKGWAANQIETRFGKGFVAGFANGCAGDVSGNFEPGVPGFTPAVDPNPNPAPDFRPQQARMKRAGEAQADMAVQLMADGAVLVGPVTAREYRIDLQRRTGVIAALGLSMAAGSTEDGGQDLVAEGISLKNENDPFLTSVGDMALAGLTTAVMPTLNTLLSSVTALVGGNPLMALQGLANFRPFIDAALIAMHFPKPILMVPGMMHPDPWVPSMVPLQVIRIGMFGALGVPAEVTTVAGLRLERAAMRELGRAGVEMLAVSTYTNGYAQYLTTAEEYASQHYEGASNLYGAKACAAFETAVGELAAAVAGNTPVGHDGILPDLRPRVLTKRRMTFRNNSGGPIRFRLFEARDDQYVQMLWPDADFTVADGLDCAVFLPFPHSLFVEVLQVVWGDGTLRRGRTPRQSLIAATSDLVVAVSPTTVLRGTYVASGRDL